MKKLFVLLVGALVAAASLSAQPMGMPMGGGGMPDFEPIVKAQVDTLTLLLTLDAKQAKKVKSLIEDQMNDQINVMMSVMMNAASGNDFGGGRPQIDDATKATMREQSEKLNARYEKKYAKLFSPKQFEEWKTYRTNEEARRKREMEERRAKGGESGGRGGFGGGMQF